MVYVKLSNDDYDAIDRSLRSVKARRVVAGVVAVNALWLILFLAAPLNRPGQHYGWELIVTYHLVLPALLVLYRISLIGFLLSNRSTDKFRYATSCVALDLLTMFSFGMIIDPLLKMADIHSTVSFEDSLSPLVQACTMFLPMLEILFVALQAYNTPPGNRFFKWYAVQNAQSQKYWDAKFAEQEKREKEKKRK